MSFPDSCKPKRNDISFHIRKVHESTRTTIKPGNPNPAKINSLATRVTWLFFPGWLYHQPLTSYKGPALISRLFNERAQTKQKIKKENSLSWDFPGKFSLYFLSLRVFGFGEKISAFEFVLSQLFWLYRCIISQKIEETVYVFWFFSLFVFFLGLVVDLSLG